MQARIVTSAFALACAFAFVATFAGPASAYVGPKRDGANCWKAASTQCIGHWEPCPAETSHATQASSGHSHSKHR